MNIQVLTNYCRKRGIRDELLLIPKTGCLSEEDTIDLSVSVRHEYICTRVYSSIYSSILVLIPCLNILEYILEYIAKKAKNSQAHKAPTS